MAGVALEPTMIRRGAWPAAVIACAALVAMVQFVAAAEPKGFRVLGPGVLTVIPPDRATDDALQRADLLEITEGYPGPEWNWGPKLAAANTTLVERARMREYPRDIWCLEFAFKPPRLMDVDVPASDLKMQRKRIWYLVYRVRNAGGRRIITEPAEGGEEKVVRRTETFESPVTFAPQFVLESLEPVDAAEGAAAYRGYLDRLVPSAMAAIRRREDPKRPLLDSVQMMETELAPGEERWGVAIWEDVDPRIDFFSIYVRGLTNAVRWRKRPGAAIRQGDPPGSDVEETLECLRLDFWRPGDDRDAGDRPTSVGFAGMFERMTLGGRLLAATGWPAKSKARPADGLRALGLSWSDLVEPEAAVFAGGRPSVTPLAVVLDKAAGLADPAARLPAIRDLVGDVGLNQALEQLVAAVAGPVEPDQDRRRREALATIDRDPTTEAREPLDPETVGREPLKSLARIVERIEEERRLVLQRAEAGQEADPAALNARWRAVAASFFGEEAPRVDWLAAAIAKARGHEALRAIEADLAGITRGDALVAFNAVRPAIDGMDDETRKRVVEGLGAATETSRAERERIEGLDGDARAAAVRDLVEAGVFGAKGPELYARAIREHEGVEYAWVFRYEIPFGVPAAAP
jgi:hypothetical protein